MAQPSRQAANASSGQQRFALRELPRGALRFFSTFSPLDTFLKLNISDKTPDATKARSLPLNELLALALNELAADQSRDAAPKDAPSSHDAAKPTGGFFQHLPNRNSAGKATERLKNSSMLPSHPALIFMSYVWAESDRNSLTQSSHRTRYMACDYLANRPHASTPISCFQVAANKGYSLFWTRHVSWVIIATQRYMYLLTTQQLLHIVGFWDKSKQNPAGLDRTDQLETFSELWNDDPQYSKWLAFTPFRHTSLEDLYVTISRCCRPSECTSGDLFHTVPRPHSAPLSNLLGTLTQATSAAVPIKDKSRRGTRRLEDDPL